MHRKGTAMLATVILLVSYSTVFRNNEVGAQDVLKISTDPGVTYRNNYDPQIVGDTSGNSYVTWHGYDGYYWDVYWVKVDAAGTTGTIQMISTHPDNVNGQDWGPQIGVDSSGNSYVVWRGYDGYDNEIYWVRVDAAGTPGVVQKISTHPDNETREDYDPQIAVDSGGNSYVTWRCQFGSNKDIYWVKVDAAGTLGTVQKISTHADNIIGDDFNPQIAADSSGNSYVVWYGHDGTDNEIYWVKVDAAGTPSAVQKISTHVDNGIRDDWYPQIAADSSGNSYAVWYGWDGSDNEIYWTKVDATGTAGAVQKISTHVDNETWDDRYPQIVSDTSGNSCVTWQGNDGSDNEIYWTRIDVAGTSGAVQKISNHPDNETRFEYVPQIALDTSGNSYVTFQSYDGRDDEVYWVAVDSAGTPGEAEKISTHPDNDTRDDWKPQIAADPSGNSYTVWQGWDGGDWEVYFVTMESLGGGDSDGDGVPDEEDKCPLENPEGLDANLDGCTDRICDLAEVVQSLGIHHGIENSLIHKATNSCDKFNRGSLTAAVNMLNGFINAVKAQSGKKISEDDADMLIQFARNAILVMLKELDADSESAGNINPEKLNAQMRSLAQTTISRAERLSSHVQNLLSEAESQGVDTSPYEELVAKAEELLALAHTFFAEGNYIAANTNASDAIQAYEEAIASLEALLA
ncbi:MAG: hypothetical protein HXS44_13915 [Theionarchaea archaeon]|nr:hypothetical protein [Theionarchaea archaeon]